MYTLIMNFRLFFKAISTLCSGQAIIISFAQLFLLFWFNFMVIFVSDLNYFIVFSNFLFVFQAQQSKIDKSIEGTIVISNF